MGGLLTVFDCVRNAADRPISITYSSAGAVYGAAGNFRDGRVTDRSLPQPRDLYGVQRYAMEMCADVVWRVHGVASVGLRPWIVYGAGRESGLTAGPSLALLAAAAQVPYRIGFSGKSVYHHVKDVASAFIASSRNVTSGAKVMNIPGETVDVRDFIAIIEEAAPAAKGLITFDAHSLDAPSVVEDERLSALTGITEWGCVRDRVPETLNEYQKLLEAGLVNVDPLNH